MLLRGYYARYASQLAEMVSFSDVRLAEDCHVRRSFARKANYGLNVAGRKLSSTRGGRECVCERERGREREK
jgi:hypothetical protein